MSNKIRYMSDYGAIIIPSKTLKENVYDGLIIEMARLYDLECVDVKRIKNASNNKIIAVFILRGNCIEDNLWEIKNLFDRILKDTDKIKFPRMKVYTDTKVLSEFCEIFFDNKLSDYDNIYTSKKYIKNNTKN